MSFPHTPDLRQIPSGCLPADRIRIVLSRTTHPGNIGSAARAMRTMGLDQLCLVAPETEVTSESYALAAGGAGILDHARILPSLEEALRGAELVFALSARRRAVDREILDPRAAARMICRAALAGQSSALVFGCESSGLSNSELDLCGYHVAIDADPDYSSLNLAMAVQVICYEIRCAFLAVRSGALPASDQGTGEAPPASRCADGAEMAAFGRHLEEVLSRVGFLKPGTGDHVIRKIRGIFARSRLTREEVNILRGALTETQRTLDRAEKNSRSPGD